MTPFDFLLVILSRTPTWAWGVLATMVALGLRQTRPTDASAARLWLVPAAMGAYSLLGTAVSFAQAGEALAVGAWFAGAALGLAANRVLDLPRGARANADGTVHLPGSAAPMLIYLGVFLVRYGIGVSLAIAPQLRGDAAFTLGAALACSVPTGLLAARSRKALATLRPATAAAAA